MRRIVVIFIAVLTMLLGGYHLVESSSASDLAPPSPAASLVPTHTYWMGSHPAGCSVAKVRTLGSPAVPLPIHRSVTVSYRGCDRSTFGVTAIYVATVPGASNSQKRHIEVYRASFGGHIATVVYLDLPEAMIQIQLFGSVTKSQALVIVRQNEPRLEQRVGGGR